MFAAVGLRVTKLRRVRLGPLSLGALPVGTWRELTNQEVKVLLRAAGPGLARPSRAPHKGTTR